MRSVAIAALCAASAVSLAGAAKADTFVLTNTTHDNCRQEFPGLPLSIGCADLNGNGTAQAIPGGFVITGPDLFDPSPVVDPNTVTLTATALSNQILSYNFDYFTEDDANSNFDVAGVILNGTETRFSAPNLQPFVHQTGHFTISVRTGDSYGFYIFSGDSAAGPAVFTVQLADTTTTRGLPEPETWGLMLMGFGGIGAVLRRRQSPDRIGRAVSKS